METQQLKVANHEDRTRFITTSLNSQSTAPSSCCCLLFFVFLHKFKFKFKIIYWLTKEHRLYQCTKITHNNTNTHTHIHKNDDKLMLGQLLLHMCKIQHKHKSQRHEIIIWYIWWRHTAYTTLYITSLRLYNVNHTDNNKTSPRSYIFPSLYTNRLYIYNKYSIQYWIRELHS